VLYAARCKDRTQKIVKDLPAGHYRTILLGYIFATKARIDNQKTLLSSNISSTCPHNMVSFRPLAADICPVVWGTRANFNGFRVTAATLLNGSQPNFARCLAVSWAATVHIHFRGFLPRYGILPGAKFTLRPPSLATYIRQGDHHVGHWPTFSYNV